MTTLSDEIKTSQKEMMSKMSGEVLSTFYKTTQALVHSGIAGTALNVGDQFPEFSLLNAVGLEVHSAELLKNGPIIINFYRGGWCPFCNLELRSYQQHLDDIKERGGQLIAISPSLPDESLTVKERNDLSFEVLSDMGNVLAKQVGLVFELDEVLKPIYTQFGFNLPQVNGDNSWELPMPATYVVGGDGIIKYAFVDADYAKRAEPMTVIDFL